MYNARTAIPKHIVKSNGKGFPETCGGVKCVREEFNVSDLIRRHPILSPLHD